MATKEMDKETSKSNGQMDYPILDLKTAIERVNVLYKHEKRNAAPFSVLAAHWGYNTKSSGVGLTVSTLKKFGLLEKAEVGKVKISDLALNILLDEETSTERLTALQNAAIKPELYSFLWSKYHHELPSEISLKKTLVMDLGFDEKIAVNIISKYKNTLAYAKLLEGQETASFDSRAASDTTIQEEKSSNNDAFILRVPQDKGKVVLREVTLPVSGGSAIIKLPYPMTGASFDRLLQMITLMKDEFVKENGEEETSS